MKKILRIKKLNELLKYHQGHTLLELMATLDVEERTIRKDLKQIQEPPYNAVLCNEYRGKVENPPRTDPVHRIALDP